MLDNPLLHLLVVVLGPATSVILKMTKRQQCYAEASGACARGRNTTTVQCMVSETMKDPAPQVLEDLLRTKMPNQLVHHDELE